MISRLRLRLAGAALLSLTLSACSLAPVYVRPEPPVPQAASTGPPGGPEDLQSLHGLGWRDFFHDPRLRELIALGLEHNRDLRISAFSVAEARARYGLEKAERLPQLEAGGSATYSGRFEEPSARSYEAALMPAFELDFFGRLRSLSEAALQNYLATAEAEKAFRIALVSQIARAYLAELLARERLALTRSNLESRRGSRAFIEERVRSGQSSLLDLEQARGMVEFASAEVARGERELIEAELALKLLLGDFEPRKAPSSSLKNQKLAALPQGVRSTVLLERPDVMEAEHQLRAANADIGAARAAFFPSISLTGSLGYMSDDLGALFSGATGLWSFLPKIGLPIFTGGRNRANLALAEIRRESSVAQYEKTVQNAFRETAEALLSRKTFHDQYAAQERYLASQRQVLELAENRYVNGAVTYLEVLDAQRSLFQAELDLISLRRDQLVNEISLYSALGGGLKP
jgi:Cu(I)/Ag(I) efflux system outer membrane protein